MQRRDQRVATAKIALINDLMGIFTSMGPRGLAWDAKAAEDVDAQCDLIAARPSRLTVPHLRQILLAWNRWKKARPQHVDLYAPSPTHLGLFLRTEAMRGPTVASSRMRGFRWLVTNLGVPFPIHSPLVKDFTRPAADHLPKQAPTISPGDFMNILRMTRGDLTVMSSLLGWYCWDALLVCVASTLHGPPCSSEHPTCCQHTATKGKQCGAAVGLRTHGRFRSCQRWKRIALTFWSQS